MRDRGGRAAGPPPRCSRAGWRSRGSRAPPTTRRLHRVALAAGHLLERGGQRGAVLVGVRERLDAGDRLVVERRHREAEAADRRGAPPPGGGTSATAPWPRSRTARRRRGGRRRGTCGAARRRPRRSRRAGRPRPRRRARAGRGRPAGARPSGRRARRKACGSSREARISCASVRSSMLSPLLRPKRGLALRDSGRVASALV